MEHRLLSIVFRHMVLLEIVSGVIATLVGVGIALLVLEGAMRALLHSLSGEIGKPLPSVISLRPAANRFFTSRRRGVDARRN